MILSVEREFKRRWNMMSPENFKYETYPIRYRKEIMVWDGKRLVDGQVRTTFIVDAHTHPTKSFHSKEGLSLDRKRKMKEVSGYWTPFNCTIEEQLELMHGDNISKALIYFGQPSTIEESDRKNKWLCEMTQKHQELVGFALAPTDGREGTEELIEKAIKEYKLKGIGEIYPSKNIEGLSLVFEAASKLGVPVTLDILPVHTPKLIPTKAEECKEWLKENLPSFSKLKLILAHIGYLRPGVVDIIKNFKNVYADISFIIHWYEAKVAKVLEEIEAERLLFGTDFGGPTCWTPYDDIIRTERLPISENDIEKILGLNAKQLIGI